MVSGKRRMLLYWRRSGAASRVLLLLVGMGLLSILLYWQRPQDDSPYFGSNVVIFALVNLNIVVLCVLAFLIGRNVVKLVFDRRKRILGSKLRMRLVVAFVALTLIPTSILSVLASGLLTRAVEGWFGTQVESAVEGAMAVGRTHYALLKQQALATAQELAVELSNREESASDRELLDSFLERRRKAEGVFSLTLFGVGPSELARAEHVTASIEGFKEPHFDSSAIEKGFAGQESVLFEKRDGGQYVRVYSPFYRSGRPHVLVVARRIDPDLTQALNAVSHSYNEYEQLKFFKNPLKTGYVLTLVMITCLLLFSAIWIGFYLAREITVPIQRLAEGTRAIARGNYDFQMRIEGDDEISFLGHSFNSMIRELKTSRNEAERRRLYLETVLSNLAVGVIGIDAQGLITTVNAAAAALFSSEEAQTLVGKLLREVIGAENYSQVEPLLEALEESDGQSREPVEKEMQIFAQGRELKIVCTAGRIVDLNNIPLGTVFLFDDITELSKAQHMAAWREVARRIAHEIKNPLTPIQLSAQRLHKLVGEQAAQSPLQECAQTIVENVGSIKRLANEFSRFARMPTAEFTLTQMNALIGDVITPFAEAHASISFQFIADTTLPEVMADREQIRRVLINLIDNAIGALEKADPSTCSGDNPQIVVRTSYDRRRRGITFEVADNGPGIPGSEKQRIFEPYFTTKSGGTGLGLAIVTTIVSEHQGRVRVYDNAPRGARFVVELPLAPRATTQRRFAAG